MAEGQPAAAAPTAPRNSARLLPNPSSTLCQPRKQREQQRAAEQVQIQQDAMTLCSLMDRSPQAARQQATAAQPSSASAAPGQQNAAIGGFLSTQTLRTLLDVPQPSQSQLGQRGRPPGAQHGLVPADGMEDSGNVLQRQLAHLHDSASDGGSLSKPFRSVRPGPGRREVFVLSKWLEVETQRFNATYSRKDERTPMVDFLLLAASRGKAIYSQAYTELARQVTQHCEERGRLMADVWIGYATMLDRQACLHTNTPPPVLSRVHASYAAVKDRAERAQVRLEMAELQLEQERVAAETGKAELHDELARLQAELTAALSTGGSGAHVDVMAVVLGLRGEALAEGAAREGSLGGHRSVRFRESPVAPAARGSAYAGRRGTTAVEELRYGSQRASLAMGNVMRQLQDAAGSGDASLSRDDMAALQQHNLALREALDAARQELLEIYKQASAVADLQATADEVVLLESRAEAAENERDDALQQLLVSTPRPQQSCGELPSLVGEQGMLRFQTALEAHKQWPADDLALLLVGNQLHAAGVPSQRRSSALPAAAEGDEAVAGNEATPAATGCGESHLRDYAELRLGCLRAAVEQGLLTREAIKRAIQACSSEALVEVAGEEHAAWLAEALARPAASPDALADFLVGTTRQGLPLNPAYYACMQQYRQGITFDEVRSAVQQARMSTKARVAAAEAEAKALTQECEGLREVVRSYREAEQRRDVARRRREDEAALERKKPLQQYVELLGSQEESAWKEWLIGMGQAADVPRLFKHSGKVRNKHISKRDTEKMVKEIWKERMADPAAAAGKACELLEFVFQHLQKRVGIINAVVEAGYNFLYGLWKYQWDADCELFLRILMGEVKEDVYVAQVRLQEELEELFASIDKAKGQATGFIPKDDLRTAFLAYFKVGQPGGKTLKRFDELMQAMDEDQEGEEVEWRKVFEEDREFNQGEFAESIRDQFLQERVDFFKALEEAVYDEAAHEEECSREHVVRALLRVDHDMTDKAAQQTAGAIFTADVELLSVKAVMRKLSRGVVRRSRASSTKASVMGPAAGLKARGRRGGPSSEACLRAMEALRQEWITQELAPSSV